MVQRARSTSIESPAIFHRVVTANAGFICFCGAPARHLRYTSGLTWEYCERHWSLWLERHMQNLAPVPVQTVTVFPPVPV